jgi:membrane protease YdiL (CAAX protease family)
MVFVFSSLFILTRAASAAPQRVQPDASAVIQSLAMLPAVPSPAPASGPARPPAVTWPSRLLALAEVALASGFPTQLAVGAVLMLAGVHPWDSTGALSLRYLVTLLLLDTVVVVGFVVFVLHARDERARDLFVGVRPLRREFWLGVGLTPVVFLATTALLAGLRALWPSLHNVATNPFEALIHTPTDAMVLGIAAVVGGGVKEELQRAFILRRFEQSLGGARLGLVLYSLVFGAGHAMQGWDVGVITAVLGLTWGYLFLRRRCSVAPVVSHSGFNAAQILQFALLGS